MIDDISRLARDIESHWALRRTLEDMGGKLESPSVTFGEDSDSILVENLLASVSQHQRQKNGEQTKNRMRARLMNGYWVSHAPVGYKYEKVKGHGKLLVRDEPLASIVQKALEGFACARFETQAEVKRFLERHPDFPKTRYGHVANETVNRILKRSHYAGYVESESWDVSLREGHHEGLITLATFQTIQRRFGEKPKAAARPDLNADFPLRGSVLCNDCDNPLTACWSKSKTGKRHAYYHCFTKGCDRHRKPIKRDELEGEFEDMLKSLQPTESAYALLRAMFEHGWELRGKQVKDAAKAMTRKLGEVEAQIAGLLDRIVDASSPHVVAAYETRIDALEKEKLVLGEKLQSAGIPQRPFEEMFQLACGFLSSPWKIWKNGDLTMRRTVLKLTFQERLSYCRNEGLPTLKTTLPFKALGQFCRSEGVMAEEVGFEPTVRFHARRFSRPVHSTTLPLLRTSEQGVRWRSLLRS